jgi:hypothetical protein
VSVVTALAAVSNSQALHALRHGFSLGIYQIVLAIVVAIVVAALLAWQWWTVGRDHWYGDAATHSDETKPLLAHETVVVQYEPPLSPDGSRSLRPAELGLLLRERVSNADIAATIVDLAVRRYLDIREMPTPQLLRRTDYELVKLREPDDSLLDHERTLMADLFESGRSVKVSELRGEFERPFADTKHDVYEEAVHDGLFHLDPDEVRQNFRMLGVAAIVAGLIAMAELSRLGAGLVGVPIVLGGLVLFAIARAMPRRTAKGHELYRRCLGFREYVTTAETDRERFAEERDIFHEYLPYAMVFGCTKRWAKAFHELESWNPRADWYFGTTGLLPLDLAIGVGELAAGLAERRKLRAVRPGSVDR